jgi:hypothetical protein
MCRTEFKHGDDGKWEPLKEGSLTRKRTRVQVTDKPFQPSMRRVLLRIPLARGGRLLGRRRPFGG